MTSGRYRAEWWLAALVLPYILNDFAFIPLRHLLEWLVVDYGVRLATIAMAIYMLRRGIAEHSDFGLKLPALGPGLLWTALMLGSSYLVFGHMEGLADKYLPDTKLMKYPSSDSVVLNYFDMTFGLFLVALSEELIFRGYFLSVMRERLRNPVVMVVVSSVVFSTIHWSVGVRSVALAALWAAMPMASVIHTGSIIPAILAHYITDYVSFYYVP